MALLQLGVEAGDIRRRSADDSAQSLSWHQGPVLGQGAINIHRLHHSLGMHVSWRCTSLAFIAERGLQCNAAGCPHAQQHAAEYDEQGQKETERKKFRRKDCGTGRMLKRVKDIVSVGWALL